MVTNEEDDSSKKFKELVSSFKSLLDEFSPLIENAKPVYLFSLFINVAHRGGFESVTENGLWEEVCVESGLCDGNYDEVEMVYVMYLNRLVRWFHGEEESVELCDELKVRLKEFLSEVKRKYEEVRKGKETVEEVGVEFKWFVGKMKRQYDKSVIGLDDAVRVVVESPGKRKRESGMGTVEWLRRVAVDPCGEGVGCLPDRGKWEAYGSDEPWREVLLFRGARMRSDSATEKIWQKLQKMHPSLYDDSGGPSYNLRERQSLDANQFNAKRAGGGSGSENPEEEDRPCSLIGDEFQAEVPEWTDITSESDKKWLGTRTWPLSKEHNNRNLIERDPIGKGRQDPCGCQNPGSVECVRFHIVTKQEKLKLELGPSFYTWWFDVMGEGVLKYWTDLEQKKVKSLMTSPPTISPFFFDQIKRILISKSRGKVVSYFYNVTLLQFRANQSRTIPYEANSDTDDLYFKATQNEDSALEANTSQKPVMLSPKKKRRR